MRACFTINPLKKEMLFPLATMIIQLFVRPLLSLINQKVLQKKDDAFLLANSLFRTFCMYIAETLTLTFFFIQRKNTIRINTHGLEIIPGSQKQKIQSLIIIFILACVDFLASLGIHYIRNNAILDLIDLAKRSISLIVATLLSILILHYSYYRHHWLGLILISFGNLIYVIPELPNSANISLNVSWYTLIFTILTAYLSEAGIEVFEKYLMDVNFVSPFTVLGLQGVSGLFINVFLVIFIIIFPDLIGINLTVFKVYFSYLINEGKCVLIMYMLYIVTNMGYNSFRVLTVQHFYPTYLGLNGILSNFFFWIVNIIITASSSQNLNTSTILVQTVAHLIMIIGIVIYLEIIQLNFCKLNEYTATSIASRSISYYVKHVNGIDMAFQQEESGEEIITKKQDI